MPFGYKRAYSVMIRSPGRFKARRRGTVALNNKLLTDYGKINKKETCSDDKGYLRLTKGAFTTDRPPLFGGSDSAN